MSYDQGGNSQNASSVEEVTSNKRPTFLTVLCIITFIVSGFSFFGSVEDMFSSNSTSQEEWDEMTLQFEEMSENMDSDMQDMMASIMESMAGMMETQESSHIILVVIGILATLLSLLGAFWMFKLKKIGFYTYIVSKIVGVLGPLAIFGFSVFSLLMYAGGFFAAVVFIILYGTNAKHLD